MKVTINVINAFVDDANGGNPAGVVLDADQLTQSQKMDVAKRVGLSETAFISSSAIADFKLDFFTPTRQIAHCGHATIAVFSHLAQIGRIDQGWWSKETIDGTRKILINKDMAYMEQSAPKFQSVDSHRIAIFDAIGVTDKQVLFPPKLVNTGNSFIVIGVANAQVLSQLSVNLQAIEAISNELDLIGFYIFTTEATSTHRDAATRMFAPRYGISEEAATGMAAGPLACYLYQEMGIRKSQFSIEQGRFMQHPSPSNIVVDLELEDGKISSLMAGGVGKSAYEIIIDI